MTNEALRVLRVVEAKYPGFIGQTVHIVSQATGGCLKKFGCSPNIQVSLAYHSLSDHAVMALKAVHVYAMLSSFSNQYSSMISGGMNSSSAMKPWKENNNYQIKLKLTGDRVDVVSRSGFGLLYNVDQMSEMISKTLVGLLFYLRKTGRESVFNMNEQEVKRVKMTFDSACSYWGIDDYANHFITNNQDLFNHLV